MNNKMPRRVRTAIELTKAETQILEQQQIVDYDTREFPVEIIVQKYSDGLENDENELFVPSYQREFVWDPNRQSKFIESVMLGLPIPYIFTADRAGRLEIVDGSQRIRCLHAFVNDKLELINLKKLTNLNGFLFSDLSQSRKRRFNRHTLRMIELTEKAGPDITVDIFERINTGSDSLNYMEIRKGIFGGAFYKFIAECANNEKFIKLCPISLGVAKREEAEEMILRFFAYSEKYLTFKHSVREFLDMYIQEKRDDFDKKKMKADFQKMLDFAEKYFPYGFRRSVGANTTPRVRFETLSVGIFLALESTPKLVPGPVNWLDSKEFQDHTRSDGSNSKPKVKGRIEYVKNKLLAKP